MELFYEAFVSFWDMRIGSDNPLPMKAKTKTIAPENKVLNQRKQSHENLYNTKKSKYKSPSLHLL